MIQLYRPVAASIPITSDYGVRVHPVTGEPGKFHYGVDFGCPVGTPVVASVTGKIVRVGWQNPNAPNEGFGKRIYQKAGNRLLYIVYAHLSEFEVNEGDFIVAGTRIALSGNTGASSGPHLHVEARLGSMTNRGAKIKWLQ